MDGTILDDRGQLTNDVIGSILDAKKKGYIICFVTGRREIDIAPIREQCGCADYLLLDNGAELIDLHNKEVIFHKKPDRETARKIVEWCLEKDFLLYVVAASELAVNHITEGVRKYVDYLEIQPRLYSSWQDLQKVDIAGLMVTDEGESVAEFLKSQGLPLFCRHSEPNCIDLILEGTGKWQAVQYLARRLEVDCQDIIAVGNYNNDIEMIAGAGIGVAVANALDEVKEAADYITESSNNENPVGEIVDRFILTDSEPDVRDEKKYRTGVLCAVCAACLFGLSTIFTRTGVSHESVLTLVSWRFLIAFLTMTILIGLGIFKVDLKNKPIWGVLRIAAFTPGIYFLAEGKGLQLTTASEGATILAMEPILIMILAVLVLKEIPTFRQAVSILISVAGVVAIIIAKGMSAGFVLSGYLILFLAITADAMCAILTRKYLVYTPAERVYVMSILGTVLFVPLALIEHAMAGTLTEYLVLPFQNSGFLTAVLYLGIISTVGGFTLNSFAIRYLGPNRLVSFSGICTLTSVIAGVVLLHESFTILQGVGTALILLGAFNANRNSLSHNSERKQKSRS